MACRNLCQPCSHHSSLWLLDWLALGRAAAASVSLLLASLLKHSPALQPVSHCYNFTFFHFICNIIFWRRMPAIQGCWWAPLPIISPQTSLFHIDTSVSSLSFSGCDCTALVFLLVIICGYFPFIIYLHWVFPGNYPPQLFQQVMPQLFHCQKRRQLYCKPAAIFFSVVV